MNHTKTNVENRIRDEQRKEQLDKEKWLETSEGRDEDKILFLDCVHWYHG